MIKRIPGHTRSFFCLILVLMAASLSSTAAAETCNPEQATWDPNHFYPEGAVVFHKGDWYESRELHKALEPGITFDWIRLDSVPDCENRPQGRDNSKKSDDTEGSQNDSTQSHRGETASGMCIKPEQWLFSKDYEKGDLASHGGQIWEATASTRGDMPDMAEPPLWKLVEAHCALHTQ